MKERMSENKKKLKEMKICIRQNKINMKNKSRNNWKE